MFCIFCTDEDNGYLFSGKRVSFDKEILSDIIHNANINHSRIIVSDYTYRMFQNYFEGLNENVPHNIVVSRDVLDAETEDYVFVEEEMREMTEEEIDAFIIYNFNRKYPSSTKFTPNPSKFSLSSVWEFKGNSHEKITRNIYERTFFFDEQ